MDGLSPRIPSDPPRTTKNPEESLLLLLPFPPRSPKDAPGSYKCYSKDPQGYIWDPGRSTHHHEVSLLLICLSPTSPEDAPRPSKGTQKVPKDPPGIPKDHNKNQEESLPLILCALERISSDPLPLFLPPSCVARGRRGARDCF